MITESAKQYFSNNKDLKIAHLVEVELAGEFSVYDYLTDFKRDITYNGKVYRGGRIKSVGSITLTQGLTNYKVKLTVPGEFEDELEKVTTNESYEGRVLRIYRAYLDRDGSILNIQEDTSGPLYLFEGVITDVSLSDPLTSGSSVVTWECAGDLQNFEKVTGRMTNDAHHRGLISTATGPEPSSAAKREDYKTDTGFLHTDKTISTTLSYITTETEYYFKKKWHGLGGDLREREVEVEREIDLKLSLSSQYLPVIYGVRKVQGIPVFVDADKDDASKVYVVYAVCEGEIKSFLNVYVDGVSAICGPGGPSDEAATCMGNTQEGDTLSIYASSQEETYRENIWRRYPYDRDVNAIDQPPGTNITNPSADRTAGTYHGDAYNIAAKNGPILMRFYHGKSDQTPDPTLVNKAASNSFLIQDSTTKPDGSAWGADYWAPYIEGVQSGAALLDTAYVVCEFSISEDRTTIPKIDFVVEGKNGLIFSDQSTFTRGWTLNPVWHMMDYLTSPIYGAGLDFSKLNIPSFIETASRLDEVDTSYDTSFVKQWKYLGWESPTGTRAKMQCNTLIDTSNSTTKEVELLLKQFAGSLVPLRGSYHLSIENDDDPIKEIPISDLIGSIRVKNKPNKDKWNSINASIDDPARNWATHQVSFFNSNYLTEDNGIRKQGRASFDHVTNYYTARSWAEYLLNVSRFAKTVEIKTYFKHLDIRPNHNITFTYPRYGFVPANEQNKFRVTEVTDNSDGTLSFKLERYNNAAFEHSVQDPDEVQGPGTPPQIQAPSVLVFDELPDSSIPITPPEGGLYGVLYWPSIVSSRLLRYEVRGIDNSTISVPTDVTFELSNQTYSYILIPIERQTTYDFKVCSVSSEGRSAYTTLSVTTGNPPVANLPNIEGFRVINTSTNNGFFGPNVELAWELYNVEYVDSLELQVLDDQESLLTTYSVSVSTTQFTFTLAQNKAIYASNNSTAGAYRRLNFRIRAVSGTENSNWSNI